MKSFKRRSEDSLKLLAVVDFYVGKIEEKCKKSVVHYVTSKASELKTKKELLENQLQVLNLRSVKGVFDYFKKNAQIRKLKKSLVDLNAKIVFWINSVYSYFVEKRPTLPAHV
jgi:DUF2075 family protein